MSKKLEVTLVRGLQGYDRRQRETVRSLGLKRLQQSVVIDPSPANLGKLDKISHLIRVREV